MCMFNILIVCMGNICRSPMAEALFKKKLQNTDINISSAGITALVGYAADSKSQQLMQEVQIDISNHKARQLTLEIINSMDLVLVMEQKQVNIIQQQFITATGKVYRLGRWSEFDIVDPYKQDLSAFRQALELIFIGVDEWSEKLLKIKL